MMKRLWFVVAFLILLNACQNNEKRAVDEIQSSGLALTSDILADTDVSRIRFEVSRVSCDGEEIEPFSTTEEVELEDILIPGGIENLENNPLDATSAHLFADKFMTLEPGCYDVTTLPLNADGEPSRDCLPAMKQRVEVYEGSTTEILLVNQCVGEDIGSLDTISTLNHGPSLEVSFPDSKFGTCAEPIRVCATATDPDRDPLAFEWELSNRSPRAVGPRVVSTTVEEATGAVTQCVEYDATENGRYDVIVTVYDMAWRDGEPIRIEEWLEQEGYPSESHVRLSFFFYAGECDNSDTDPVIDTETERDTEADTGSETETEASPEPFDIELTYMTPVPVEVEPIFTAAVERWQRIIIEDIADYTFNFVMPENVCGMRSPEMPVGRTIDDLEIYISIGIMDGPGNILGGAAPCFVRPDGHLPAFAVIGFDIEDLGGLVGAGIFEATVLHEFAHALGYASVWDELGLLADPSGDEPVGIRDTHFTGAEARAAFNFIGGDDYTGMRVPVENTGVDGTRNAHWRENVLLNELMTGFIHPSSNPLSILTIASMADLGYTVDESQADPFSLETALSLRGNAVADEPVFELVGDVLDLPMYTESSNGELEAIK